MYEESRLEKELHASDEKIFVEQASDIAFVFDMLAIEIRFTV